MHFKSISIYFFFNVISALIPIIAMPILTRYLTPTDYGLMTVFTITTMFAGNIFRLELNTALKREFVDNLTNFSPYISSAFVFSLFQLLAYITILLFIMPFFDTVFNLPVFWLFMVVFLVYFRFQIISLHHLWQINNRALPYGLWGVFTNVAVFGTTIFLVSREDFDWQARAWAECSIGLISLPIAIYYLKKEFSLKFNINLNALSQMLKFSLPLLPSTLMGYFLLVSDRIFISELAGLHQLGLYTIAVQLAASVDLIFRALLPAWESWIYTKLGEIDVIAVRQILLRFALMTLGGIMIIICLPPVLKLIMPYLTDKSFEAAETFLVPCLFSASMAGLFRLMSVPLIFMRRTSTVSYINMSMVIVVLILMFLTVKQWGAIGAAYALAVTFIYGMILQIYFITQYRIEKSEN